MVNIPHRTVISYYLRNDKRIHKGSDYFLLEGGELREFKTENPEFSKTASCVAVIAKTGFAKLMRAMRMQVQTPECFQKEPDMQCRMELVKPTEKPGYIQARDSKKFQNALEGVRRKLTAVSELLNLVDRFDIPAASFERRIQTIVEMDMQLSVDVTALMGAGIELVNR